MEGNLWHVAAAAGYALLLHVLLLLLLLLLLHTAGQTCSLVACMTSCRLQQAIIV